VTDGPGPGSNDRVAVTAEVLRRLDGRTLALFYDFDGTLTPIVDDPDAAVLAPATRTALARLSERGWWLS
jgi:trehalose-6-phosphatase